MTEAYKSLLGIVPTINSASLVAENIRNLKKRRQRLLHSGVSNIVGTAFIKTEADFIAGL